LLPGTPRCYWLSGRFASDRKHRGVNSPAIRIVVSSVFNSLEFERIKNEAGCDEVVANCDHLWRLKFSPTMPFAFTEHGALMAASAIITPRVGGRENLRFSGWWSGS
jgi:hypothetical protein